MRALLRRLMWNLIAWLPVKDSGRVEQAWSVMNQALSTVDSAHDDPVRRSRFLLTLFSQGTDDAESVSANEFGHRSARRQGARGKAPTPARLELLAERWERALVVNSVIPAISGLHQQLVTYAQDLARQVSAPATARMSAFDIGAHQAAVYRASSESFLQVAELVTAFLCEVGQTGAAERQRWVRVVAEFAAGFAAATQIRALDEQEKVFAAIAEVHRKNHEGYLVNSTADFRDLPVPIVVVTRKGRIVETNAAFQRLLGFGNTELAARSLMEFVLSGEDQQILDQVCRALPTVRSAGHSSDIRFSGRNRETPVWVQLHWAPSSSQPDHVHIALHDTTYHHIQHDWHLGRTQYDEVTNLPTKAQLLDRLIELHKQSAPAVVGLYGIRLVGIAGITQTLGIGTGDEVLAALAARIARTAMPPAELVAHLDRDTIAVLVTDPTSWADAGEMVRRLVDWVSHPVRTHDEYEVTVRPVVGAAQGRAGEVSPQNLLRQLEISMRPSTDSNDRRLIDVAHSERDTRRNRELARLSSALDQDELTLIHQPIARVATEAIAGSHARIQWANLDRWQSSVAELVDLADVIGLSLAIGPWLIRQAAMQARKWELQYGTDAPFVRIDVPDRLAADGQLVHHVRVALEETGLSPHQLVLGLTEVGVLGDDGQPRPHLFRLAALRVRLVLVGLGVSVQRFDLLPTTVLYGVTIAPGLTAGHTGLVPPQGGKSVLPGLIGLVQQLGLTVSISEIDTTTQMDNARRVKADFVEGRAVGPAGAAAAIEALVGPGNSRAKPS